MQRLVTTHTYLCFAPPPDPNNLSQVCQLASYGHVLCLQATSSSQQALGRQASAVALLLCVSPCGGASDWHVLLGRTAKPFPASGQSRGILCAGGSTSGILRLLQVRDMTIMSVLLPLRHPMVYK